MAKPQYLNLGTMIEKRDKQTNKPILDDNGNKTYYIKIDAKSKVTINGIPVTGYFSVSRPEDKYYKMCEKGTISEAERDHKVAQYEEGGEYSYCKFEFSKKVD